MKKVTAYKSNDGNLYECLRQAKAFDIIHFFKKEVDNSRGIHVNLSTAHLIIKHFDELKEIVESDGNDPISEVITGVSDS